MKPLPMLLLNVALVVAAVVVYDQLRSDPTSENTTAMSAKTDPAVLERLATLEAERRPLLQGPDPLPDMVKRLDALEAALARLEAAKTETSPHAESVSAERTVASAPAGEPTAEEVHRFRKLQRAARRQERAEKTARWVNGAVGKLGLNLTPRQLEKIQAAYVGFEPRRDEIWTEIKQEAAEIAASGGQVNGAELRTKGSNMIQEAFAEAITGIVSHTDAEIISQALHGK